MASTISGEYDSTSRHSGNRFAAKWDKSSFEVRNPQDTVSLLASEISESAAAHHHGVRWSRGVQRNVACWKMAANAA